MAGPNAEFLMRTQRRGDPTDRFCIGACSRLQIVAWTRGGAVGVDAELSILSRASSRCPRHNRDGIIVSEGHINRLPSFAAAFAARQARRSKFSS